MTTTQLKYFLAVLEFKSFSAAAEETYVSQSALSKQIKSLENELGTELFVRSNNKIQLSAGGNVFLKYATDMNRSYEALRKEISSMKDDAPSGYISLGVLPLMAEYHIADQLTGFQKSTDIQVDILEADQEYIQRLLLSKKIDLAILRLDYLSQESFEFVPIQKDTFVFLCSQKTRQSLPADLVSMPVHMLSDFEYIFMNKESALSKICSDYFYQKQIHPHIKLNAGRHLYLLSMVAKDLGVALMPRTMVNTQLFSNLVTIPLEDPIETTIGIVHLRQRPLSPDADMLFDYFAEQG